MTPKQRVLKRYPRAKSRPVGWMYEIIDPGGYGISYRLGWSSLGVRAAWAAAAKKIKERK